MQVKLTADVMCDWFGYEPIYRVYVDGYLITERSYIWDNSYEFIREHVVVDIAPGPHTFVVEPILFPGSNATYTTTVSTASTQVTLVTTTMLNQATNRNA